MNAITAILTKQSDSRHDDDRAADGVVLDPLDDDHPDDDLIVTTRRALCRVALVATEAAGRFERDGVAHDPMSWMLAPRRLFGGAAAIDACLDRDACMRGVLVHGLGLGLDIDPVALDALTADDDWDEDDGTDVVTIFHAVDDGSGDGGVSPFEHHRPRGRLFTATVVANDGFETVQAFHASIASDEAEISGRLFCRMGAASADAVIVEGFDPSDPLVGALVSPAISQTLTLVAENPRSALAAGLDLNVEQRFYG